MKKTILFSTICAGIAAMASQIILVREFLVVSSGDELSIGLILACWLISTALGSLVLGNFTPQGIKSKIFLLWLCCIFCAAYLPLSIFLCRSIRPALNINPGEILPFSMLGVCAFFILLPVCAIFGFIFSLVCSVYEDTYSLGSVGIAKVYAFEAVGSMLGGLLASFLLIRIFNSFEALAALSICIIVIGFFIIFQMRKVREHRKIILGINLIFFIVYVFLFLSGAFKNLEIYSLKKQWLTFEVLESKNTMYGNLVSLRRGGQISFFENGVRLYTVNDRQSSEEAVHFCLLEHKSARDVLLVGGGVAGLLEEILKHPVSSVDYVELDPALIRMAKKELPGLHSILSDKRVHIINTDAVFFLKNTTKKYDCIILHLGSPYGAQINRFYTYEFFSRLKRTLNNNGIVSFYLTASENYLNPASADLLRCVYATLKAVFKDVLVIPGDTAYFLATDTPGSLTYDYTMLMERAKERGLNLQYVREYYLSSRLSPDKIEYLNNVLEKGRTVNINRDFKPCAYYYGVISWSSRFKDSLFTSLLQSVNAKRVSLIFGGVLLAVLIFGAVKQRSSILIALISAGFCQSIFQIILLYAFQVIYGYLFYKIGILFAFFMVGLGASAWWFARGGKYKQNTYSNLLYVQLGITVFSLALPLMLLWLTSVNSVFMSWLGANIFFPGLSLLSGLFGGSLFSYANHIYCIQTEGADRGKTAALTYGLDCMGACLGAGLCGIFLIPIIGIVATCSLLAGLNLIVFGLLLFYLIASV